MIGPTLEERFALMLVERCNWHELILHRHGFTSEKLMALAEVVAADGLRRRGASLGDRFEDLVARLQRVGLEAAMRYNPHALQLQYGRNGGDPFRGYISDVMDRRIDDHFRSRAEGFSDRRYKNHGVVTPSDELDSPAEHQHAVEDALEHLDSSVNLEWYMQAAEAEDLRLGDWIIRALNERASRTTTRPRVAARQKRALEQGPDHWPGQELEEVGA